MIKEHQKEQKFKKKKIVPSVKKLKFNCTKCEAKFSEHTDYIEHVKSHDGKRKSGKPSGSTYNVKPHGTYCLKFEKDYNSTSALKKHYDKVHMKDHKVCDKCGNSFALKYTLATHIDVEHHGKCFQCTYEDCDKQFKRKDQLSIHIMKHKGEATFVCSESNKNFYHRNHFENHVNLHGDICKYSCPKCGKMFLYNQDMYQHMDSCGVEEKQFKCQIGECLTKGKGFTTKLSLSQHMKSYHHIGDIMMCSICAYTTHNKNTYQKHKLKHEKK